MATVDSFNSSAESSSASQFLKGLAHLAKKNSSSPSGNSPNASHFMKGKEYLEKKNGFPLSSSPSKTLPTLPTSPSKTTAKEAPVSGKVPGMCHRVLKSGKKKHGYCNKPLHKNGMCKYHFYKKRKAEPFHPMFN